MNHSIITEYQQEAQFSPNNLRANHQQSKSPQRQGEQIYTNKLEAKARQIKAQIKKNKPIIDQLKAQRKFLKKICEKQRHKIQGTKIDLLKSEYENQIDQLRLERHKLQDVITIIHEQSSNKAKDFVEAKEQIAMNHLQLTRALQQIKNQNQLYSQMILSKTEAIDMKIVLISELNKEIKGKESVQRKYKQVMSQIQQIQYFKRRDA